MPRTTDYRHSRQDRWVLTELAFTLVKNATKPSPFEIIPLQTTRKENNWKTEEALERAAVTLETERIKGSNPWCLWWWYIIFCTVLGFTVINSQGISLYRTMTSPSSETVYEGVAFKSLVRPTSRRRRTESMVSLERGVCSCVELQAFSCYRGWKEACQATRPISTTCRRDLSSSFTTYTHTHTNTHTRSHTHKHTHTKIIQTIKLLTMWLSQPLNVSTSLPVYLCST